MDATSTSDLETQLNAVLGFILWIQSSPSEQSDEDSDFAEQLIHVLQIYGWELNRRIDSGPATPEWCRLVSVTSRLAALLQDELYELHRDLLAYCPEVEPQSINQMIARLLFDALRLFAECKQVSLPHPQIVVA